MTTELTCFDHETQTKNARVEYGEVMTAQLAIVAKDRTAAERQRRHRQRHKAQKMAPTVTPAVTTPTVTTSRRYALLPFALLCSALAVAAVSASFSIVGLTSVFAGAFWPIICMGVALKTAKLAAVAWLGRRYAASEYLKGGVVTLVFMLMGLISSELTVSCPKRTLTTPLPSRQ